MGLLRRRSRWAGSCSGLGREPARRPALTRRHRAAPGTRRAVHSGRPRPRPRLALVDPPPSSRSPSPPSCTRRGTSCSRRPATRCGRRPRGRGVEPDPHPARGARLARVRPAVDPARGVAHRDRLRRGRGRLLRVPRRGLPPGRPIGRVPARPRHRARCWRSRSASSCSASGSRRRRWLGVGAPRRRAARRPAAVAAARRRDGPRRPGRRRLRAPDRRDDRHLLGARPGRRPAGAGRGSTPGSCGRCARSGCSRSRGSGRGSPAGAFAAPDEPLDMPRPSSAGC